MKGIELHINMGYNTSLNRKGIQRIGDVYLKTWETKQYPPKKYCFAQVEYEERFNKINNLFYNPTQIKDLSRIVVLYNTFLYVYNFSNKKWKAKIPLKEINEHNLWIVLFSK